MNVRLPKEEMALHLSQSMSHYFRDDEMSAQALVQAPAPRGLVGWLQSAVQWLADLPRRRAVLDELSLLSDHELSDIGLSRCDLDRVFNPEFAAARRASDLSSRRAAAHA